MPLRHAFINKNNFKSINIFSEILKHCIKVRKKSAFLLLYILLKMLASYEEKRLLSVIVNDIRNKRQFVIYISPKKLSLC